MELVLANTVQGLSRFVRERKPDMLVAHGDRVESLATAIVGALSNTLVGHIEGGEVSGTVDELLRHAASKLCHVHFVSNAAARRRLLQLGENPDSIHVIGSPDIDLMLSDHLPPLDQVREHYEIPFDSYAIVLFHPVTTELGQLQRDSNELVDALLETTQNYVVIYPNDDHGCDLILAAYRRLEKNPRFRILPSLRFECFLTLLKHARFIIGNSSSGIHEAPVYGVPTICIGTRQRNRFHHESIVEIRSAKTDIIDAVRRCERMGRFAPAFHFGDGSSARRFLEALRGDALWRTPIQKSFKDMEWRTPHERG